MSNSNQLLWDEMLAAARNYRPDRLDKFGIKPDHAIAAGGLVAANISPTSEGLFEFGGELSAVILPVYFGVIPTEDVPVDDLDLSDILAFRTEEPGQWWLRRGEACLLGAGALDGLYLGAELQVRRNPLTWLQGHAKGCVVLDWQRVAGWLRPIATLLAEDTDHGLDIRRHLQRPLLIPEIRVPESTIEGAE